MRLTINPSNTEYLVAGNSGNNLIHGDAEIKNRDYYKYLDVTNGGRSTEELSSRVNQGNTATRQLNGILWHCLLYTSRCV